jgi:hypothetical protein
MKNSYKVALLAALGLASVSVAQAQFTINDLYLGFTQSSASSDLIIDLGQAGNLIGGTSQINLSADLGGLTAFNSTFNPSSTPGFVGSGVTMGILGANNTAGSDGVFTSENRTATGNPISQFGSVNISSKSHSQSSMANSAAVVNGIMSAEIPSLPTAGNLVTDPDKTMSVALGSGTTSFYVKSGVTPTGVIGGSGVIEEDLWSASQAAGSAGAYTYDGVFTFNYGNDSLTFDPATESVPEPSTLGLLAGGGLLLVLMRGKLIRKQA